MGQGELDGADLAGDGVEDRGGNIAVPQVHVQVQVVEAGVLRDVQAVDRPEHAVPGVDLQGDVLAGQLLKHLPLQGGAAGAQGDLHRVAGPGVPDVVNGLVAEGGVGRLEPPPELYRETVTVQVALAPLPSAAVAVMTAVPGATAVTTPFWSTVATALSLLVQVTAWLVALSGATVAVRVRVLGVRLEYRDAWVWLRVTPVTGTAAAVTVTVQEADFVLSPCAVTVMVAVPSLTALTTPLFTVATLGLSLLHVTFLLVALFGSTVAISVPVPPSIRFNVLVFSDTPVTGTLVCSPIVILNSLLSDP